MLTVQELWNKGLVQKGIRIRTNASSDGICRQMFTGVISHIYQVRGNDAFSIKRDDGVMGNGPEGEWYVFTTNTAAEAEIAEI